MSIGRIPVFVIYFLRYLIFEPFRLLEVFWFDDLINEHEMNRPPIFVLGHWRSGTSHMQNLMRLNPEFTFATIYTSLFSDHYFVTEKWLKNPLNRFCKFFKIQYAIQRVPMDLDIPGELDTALCSSSSESSYTWGHIFPKHFENFFDELIAFKNPDKVDNWLEEYDFLMRKLSYRSKNKRVIVKSPGDTARIKFLIEKYPNAQFIFIHRDPFEVFRSNQHLWEVIQKQNSLQKIAQEEIDRLIIEGYTKLMFQYIEQCKLIPSEQLIEIRFQDLQTKTQSELQRIYTKFGLGEFPENELEKFLDKNKSFTQKDHFLTPELEKELRKSWDFAFKHWGY